MSNPLSALAVLALLALPVPEEALAADTDKPIFSFGGFGTVGAAHSTERSADFVKDNSQPKGTGRSGSWTASVDSLLAGQVTATLTPRLSAILQVIAEQNYDNSFTPHVEWANVNYQFTPDFNVRIGRTILPVFLNSETRKVAYTYAWVRPPLELYQLVPPTYSDGLDASHRLSIGDLTNTLQVVWGKSRTEIPHGLGTVRSRDGVMASDTIGYGALTAHLTLGRADLDVGPANTLFGAFRQFGPEGVAIADKYGSSPISFVSVGASFDPGEWFTSAEWGHLRTRSAIGNRTAWYATGGYRFGPYTPYVTYARASADNLSDPGLTIGSLPPSLAGPAAALNAGLNSVLRSKPVQDTVSVGTRWDVVKNTALKLQLDHTRVRSGSNGVLINVVPGYQPSRFSVVSAKIDFIF